MTIKQVSRQITKFIILHRSALALATFYIVSCFFYSHYLYSWDSGQFALATINFDLNAHQPHPPGYPLLVFLGYLFKLLTRDFNMALVILNWLAGAGAVWLMYQSSALLSNKKVAWWITILFIVNPVFWFNHNVALSYTFEVFGVLMAIYAILKTLNKGGDKYLYLNAVVGGLIIGLRPSFAVFFCVLFLIHLFCARKIGLKKIILVLLLFIASTLAWFVPFMWSVGIDKFFISLRGQYASLPATYKFPEKFAFYAESLMLGFNLLPLLILTNLKSARRWLSPSYLIIIAVTIFSLGFYYFSHFGNVAYVLSFLPLTILILTPFVQDRLHRPWFVYFLLIIIIVQGLLFLKPWSLFKNSEVRLNNYQTILRHDRRLKTHLNKIKELSVDNDSIVTSVRGQYYDKQKKVRNSRYTDIRVLSYYAPETMIYELLNVRGSYNFAQYYSFNQVNQNTAVFPKTTRHFVVLVAYLHPLTLPKGLPVKSLFREENDSNIYEFDISQVNKFNFLGMNFIRASH